MFRHLVPAPVCARRRQSAALAIVLLVACPLGQAAPLPVRITLEEARTLAVDRNPALRSAIQGRLAAEGARKEADALLWHNPELSAETRDRRITSIDLGRGRLRDSAAGISQTFETGGQGRHRRAAARDLVRASEIEADIARRMAEFEAERRFVAVLALQERIALAREMLHGFEETSVAVAKRVRVGEDSRLDGNVAQVERERAWSSLAAQEVQLLSARQALAEWLQLPAPLLPEATGTLDPPSVPGETRAGDVASTVQELSYRESEARNRLALERAARSPDVTLGLNRSREKSLDGTDDITTLSISIPLPIFRRNDAAIGRAAGDAFRAGLARQSAERELATQRVAQESRVSRLAERVRRLRELAMPALLENQRLSARAFAAGELGVLQMILITRQVIEGQRDLLDARWELRRAQIDRDVAAAGILEDASRSSGSGRTNVQE